MAAGDTPNYAYVTLITRSSYLAGVVVLAHTLRAHGSSYPLVVLYTASLPASSVRALEAEAPRTNLVLQPCEPLLPRSDTPVHLIAERFADTWTKLRVFSLLRYDTLCYLDADMAVFNGSMDAIFAVAEAALPRGRADGEDRIAANHACVCNLDGDAWAPPDWTPANCAYTPLRHPRALAQPTPAGGPVPAHHLLNSGMFVFRPRAALWARMLRFFDTTDRLGGYKFPDQDFLADFFRGRWVSVGWQFNALKTMRYWHPAMWRDDAVVCLHYIVDKPWARRVGDDGVAGYLGRDGETHRWWWACFAEWERQREGLEVLELVRRCVARPPGEEGDEDADMKAIGSQVQAFAKNKPNGKESESNGAANGVANGAARENGAAKENGAVKENGAARENGDREQSDRQVNGEAPAQGPHGPILRKKMLGERGHGPVVHDTPNGS